MATDHLPATASEEPMLKQVLRGWQIFMITISAVVGTGILHGDSEALEVAGPGGMLFAFILVAFVVVCVMEGISEMIQMFPVPNPFVEYVGAFVDPDWAWVVGIAYWYTYASLFATQLVFAASFTKYWNLQPMWSSLAFYLAAPIVLLGINTAGVWHFGWIETVGGILKICLVVGTSIFLYFIDRKDDIDSRLITEGFKSDSSFAANKAIAACYVIPTLLYSFLGVEVVGITAFEARDLRSLRRPSNNIAYVVFGLYLLVIVGELLTVGWLDKSLPEIYGAVNDHVDPKARTRTIIAIAALHANHPSISGLFNGCLLYSALSAANTNLYIASRTLYGLTRKIQPGWFHWLGNLGTVWHRNGVPMFALVLSAVTFMWVPVLQGAFHYSTATLTEIMTVTASLSCLIVWASQCLAFIRYHHWLCKHERALIHRYPRDRDDPNSPNFNRKSTKCKNHSYLGSLQPIPAYLGLVICLAIILVFSTATWWSTPVTFTKVAVAYGPPVVLLTLFFISKLLTRRLAVTLDDDCEKLFRTLDHLTYIKVPRQSRHGRGLDPEATSNVETAAVESA